MAHTLDTVVQYVRSVAASEGASDGELLHSFATSDDQAAFTALVKRHGPLVLSVCKRILGNLADAEDAFQATFVVLARSAAKVPQKCSLSSWLHGVAYRTALHARRLLVRRRRHERHATSMVSINPAWEAAWREVQLLLDQEIQRLPQPYREPFVLCCLEGQSYASAAQRLGVKEGIVRSRLEEARKRLRARLSRRGVELTAVLGAAALAPSAATAQVAATLIAKAVSAATSPVAPVSVTTLVTALTASSAMRTAKVGVALFVAFSAMVGTIGMGAFQDRPGEQETKPLAQRASEQKAMEAEPSVAKDIYGDPLPVGALARMGSVRLRHAGLSDYVILSGGKTALSAGSDRVLRFWDLETGAPKRAVKLDGDLGPGNCVTLAPDGQTLAAVFKGEVVFWETGSGKQIKTVPAPHSNVVYLYFSPDGQTLAVGRGDWQVTFLEWKTGKERLIKLPVLTPENVQFNTDSTFHGSFSPDGKWFVAGAQSLQPLGIFDFKTGQEIHRLACAALTSTVSPDSKRLAVASRKNERGEDETVIRLFDLASGKEIAKFPQGTDEGVFSLAFAPDGNRLACARSFRSGLLDLRAGKVVYRLPGWQSAPTFSPDGNRLLTSGGATSLHCWDAATGKEERQPRPAEFTSSPVLAISPDGQRLASHDENLASRQEQTVVEQTVYIWNAATGRQTESLPLKVDQRDVGILGNNTWLVGFLSFTRDGQTLISAQKTGFLQYWATGTGKEQRSLQLRDPKMERLDFYQLHASADGKLIETLERAHVAGPPGALAARPDPPGKESTRLALWDASTGKLLRHHALPAGATECAWLADGAYVAFRETDGLTLMEVETGRPQWHVGGPSRASLLAVSPDDRLLAALQDGSSGASFTVGIWEAATGQKIATVKTGRVSHLALAPDNRSLITTDEAFLRTWDLATGKERGRLALPVGVFRLLLSPDGRRAFTALADGTALVWDLTSGLQEIEWLVKGAGPKEIAAWWEDLTGDADRAFAAVWRLADAKADPVLSFLRQNLKPISDADDQKIRSLIADLDSDSFKVRENARTQLESLGSAAVPVMRLALESSSSPEVRNRLERLLSRTLTHSPKTLRSLRAIQVLERIGSKDARRLLTEIANGQAHAPETLEAKTSLERMSRRDIKP